MYSGPIPSLPVAQFDLIVVGSGSGNTVINHEMSHWQIALVEESKFGGTCLNFGCIPTKMYVYAADVASTVRHADRYGIDATLDRARWADIRDRIFGRIDPISQNGRDHRHAGKHTRLFESHAEFTSPTSLRLGTGEELSSERIVIASGSRASIPDLVTDSGVAYETSDTIMRLEELPERLIILGGGYIAAEFAHIFSALGTHVTLLVRGAQLMSRLDGSISRRFTDVAHGKWDLRCHAQIASLTSADDGSGEVRIALADGTSVAGDTLLVATGRVPNSDRMGLDVAGVEVDEHGRVVVDEFQRTTVSGIWALGDVSSADQLKHVANQDARVVAHNLVHPQAMMKSNHHAVPSAVFTEPQIASVGMTEEQAVAAELDYVSAVQTYGSTAYGWAMEDTTGVCKLLCERSTGRLLGAHLMGPQASLLIQPLIQAMSFGQRVSELASHQYWIHPAMTEVVENALLLVEHARTMRP
ncbi:MAG: mycothione reductase [Pseudonocardiales bacterium]|nr:mycothione reductase [Pseudonocardiales bacterium]